ncbi:MAG TPA: hypothetical protein VFF16_00585 [Telluria sp.]|nr:hypothetical protein [Telluria sp.]
MTDQEFLKLLESIKALLISVSTGGPRIQEVESRYQQIYGLVALEFMARGLDNPIPFPSLWDWYSRWSSEDFPTYQSRREYINQLLNPALSFIWTGQVNAPVPTGWSRVDRCVAELRTRMASAQTEEQYQAVGLLSREALISAAQMVFDPSVHRTHDGVAASPTDAKRMLDAFIGHELGGGANEEARRHARSTLDFAVALQHRRTATFRDAALCVEATTATISIAAILAGRRDRS